MIKALHRYLSARVALLTSDDRLAARAELDDARDALDEVWPVRVLPLWIWDLHVRNLGTARLIGGWFGVLRDREGRPCGVRVIGVEIGGRA